ncbi:MAG TPA: YrdB family protein [Actinoplanes sp.]|nr:YrdB family protein [Actinoplanes sp.]
MSTSEKADSLPLTGWRGLVLVIRFLTELVLFGAFGFAGAVLPGPLVAKIVLAVAVPAVAIVVWALFLAPRAGRRLPEPWRFLAEVVLFVAAGAGVAAAGHPSTGILLVGVAGVGVAALTRVAAPGK